MKPFRLSRRTLLQGMGAAVALPTLEAMLDSHGTALASGAPLPRRFATFFWGNGVILREWVPQGTGEVWRPSRALEPLASVKEYVNVISGYMVKTPNRRGHHNGAAGILSGHPFIQIPAGGAPYASKFGGPSVDQVAAASMGRGPRFASLQVAVSKRVVRGEGPTLQFISHKGADQPMPPEFNPAALFNRLFAASPQAGGPPDPRAQLRVSVLDAVREDSRRLSTRLGRADQARLDAHLTSISELRQQLLALPQEYTAACTKPAPVTQTNQDSGGREPLEQVSRAMADLLTLAWACDLTRVASVMFSGSVGGHVFHMLGQSRGNHDLTHDSGAQQQVADSVVWVMRQLAYWLGRLKATPEVTGGNLLDSACILASSDVAEGLFHSVTDYPVLVAGRAGGYLRYPGVHHRSTSQQNTSDVLLTCLKAVGAGVDSVGSGAGASSTECAPLKA